MMIRQTFIRLHITAWSLLVLTGCSESLDQEAALHDAQEEVVRVTVAEIQPWRKGTSRRFPGVVRPGRRAMLSTRASGTIQAIRVEAGDRVSAGDELVSVESRDVEAMLEAAESQVKAAEAAHEQTIRDVQRLQRLAAEDLIARNRLEYAQVKQREAAAQAEQARAQVRIQQVNRSYAHIAAPFDGIVSDLLLDEGTFTGPGHPVLILEDRSSVRIDVPVSARMAEQIAASEDLSIVSPLSDETFSVRYVATVPAPELGGTGQFVRLSLAEPPAVLQPGQVVDVVLTVPASTDWVALPRSALIARGQLTGTMVVDQQQEQPVVRLRWIQTADDVSDDAKTIAVTQGLAVGEHVVLNPSPKLHDGQRVDPELEAP